MCRSTSVDVTLLAPPGFPMIVPGDDLASAILASFAAAKISLEPHDIIVLAQKIVSKAEGRAVTLATVVPSPQAVAIAADVHKDPRLVELILRESRTILRKRPGVLIVEHRSGVVLANAGIDQSNVDQTDGETVLLLPVDADASARALRQALVKRTGVELAVVIIDSVGRAWRNGTVGLALGVSGMPGLLDLRGRPDLNGRPLRTSELGLADEVAAAASLLMGQAAEGRPVVLVRGLAFPEQGGRAADLLRDPAMDLFR